MEYFNNATIVDLVERPHRGILAVLDEACSSAGTVTDRIFLQTLDTHHRHHPHYASRQVPKAHRRHTARLGGAWGLDISSAGVSTPPFLLCLDPGPSLSPLQLCPTDKTMEFGRDFRIKHYAGDVT